MTAATDFDAVDRRLRAILDPLRQRLTCSKDGPDGLDLEVPGSPELPASMSPGLRRRMQGKSCFNITTVDEPLIDELARLTETSYEPFVAMASALAGDRSTSKTR